MMEWSWRREDIPKRSLAVDAVRHFASLGALRLLPLAVQQRLTEVLEVGR